MKVLAVLLYVVGASAVLYVSVYRASIRWEPIDSDFVYRYWAVYLVGMTLVLGGSFLWPKHRDPDREEDSEHEQ